MKKKRLPVLAVAVATVLALTGCAGGSGSGGSGSSVVVGSVNALSGGATFSEASQAAKAVFDRANATGGVNGHKIDYKIADDKGDPATAGSVARQVVGGGAVALVGGASLIDCQINEKYYERQKILSMPGIGVDATCFDSPNIAPANVGPFHDMTLSLLYGTKVLHLDHVCALLEVAGNTLPAYKAAIQQWTDITGQKLIYEDPTVPYGASDYTPYIVKARQAGCKAITINPVEPDSIGQMKAMDAQGWKDVTWLNLTSIYSANYANAVTNAGAGVYVPAEFYPFTDAKSAQTKDWRDLMTKNHISLTAFSQGGYLAATYFLQVLKGIKGDITRSSVTKALHEMQPVSNPMSGTPYVFGPGKTHNENTAGWPVKLHTGTHKWQLAADDWLRLPSK